MRYLDDRCRCTNAPGLVGIVLLLLAIVDCAAGDLPGGLTVPDRGVVCNPETATCYDRFGPSIGLTEAFLGRVAAERLHSVLRAAPAGRVATLFSPASGIECRRETGPCLGNGEELPDLDAALYGPWKDREAASAEAAAIVNVDWQWLGTRYGDDTQSIPTDASRYRLRLEPDGRAHIQADCNGMGAIYRIEDSRITLAITHSTLAICPPGSLDQAFVADLAAAAIYFIRQGKLYVDLQYDTGTMEFGR